LRHKAFRTRTQRMGKVVRLHHSGLAYWQVGAFKERESIW
jgi:hypothetical protein